MLRAARRAKEKHRDGRLNNVEIAVKHRPSSFIKGFLRDVRPRYAAGRGR
jgi:hypothetical protein